jgi:hypothetical protein
MPGIPFSRETRNSKALTWRSTVECPTPNARPASRYVAPCSKRAANISVALMTVPGFINKVNAFSSAARGMHGGSYLKGGCPATAAPTEIPP